MPTLPNSAKTGYVVGVRNNLQWQKYSYFWRSSLELDPNAFYLLDYNRFTCQIIKFMCRSRSSEIDRIRTRNQTCKSQRRALEQFNRQNIAWAPGESKMGKSNLLFLTKFVGNCIFPIDFQQNTKYQRGKLSHTSPMSQEKKADK